MLVHKSVDIRPELWRKLRLNAELSGVSVRDYLSYLIAASQPVEAGASEEASALAREKELNRQAGPRPR